MTGDVCAYVAAGQVVEALPFTQAGNHGVEPGLEDPDLPGVIDNHARAQVAPSHPPHRRFHLAERLAHRAGGYEHEHEAGDEADGRQVEGRVVHRQRPARDVVERVGEDGAQRDARSQRPRQDKPLADSEASGAQRRSLARWHVGERLGVDRAHPMLDEQEGQAVAQQAGEDQGAGHAADIARRAPDEDGAHDGQ